MMEQVEVWREAVNRYKETYAERYNGNQPKEWLIEVFCREYKIPWPLPRAEEEEPIGLPTRMKMKFGKECEG